MRHFKIIYNNKTYEFDAEETGVAVSDKQEVKENVEVKKEPANNTPVATSSTAVKSPISGKVINIPVKVGDRVEEGDSLAILDSMKMELAIQAESAGTVLSIEIAVGDLIEMDQTVMTIE